MTTTTLTQGPSLLKLLAAHGIEAANVTRNRRTGMFTVTFADPQLSDFHSPGIAPAKEWAARIMDAVQGFEVYDTYDSKAEWRNPTQPPVLYATVFLKAVA